MSEKVGPYGLFRPVPKEGDLDPSSSPWVEPIKELLASHNARLAEQVARVVERRKELRRGAFHCPLFPFEGDSPEEPDGPVFEDHVWSHLLEVHPACDLRAILYEYLALGRCIEYLHRKPGHDTPDD